MQELEILEEMKRIKDGNRKEKLYAKYPPNSEDQKVLNAYSQGYEDGTDNFYNVVADIVRKHLSRENGHEITSCPQDKDGWIPVEERLPNGGIDVEVTVRRGYRTIGYYNDLYEDWYSTDESRLIDVIAWKEPSEPYRPERSEEE